MNSLRPSQARKEIVSIRFKKWLRYPKISKKSKNSFKKSSQQWLRISKKNNKRINFSPNTWSLSKSTSHTWEDIWMSTPKSEINSNPTKTNFSKQPTRGSNSTMTGIPLKGWETWICASRNWSRIYWFRRDCKRRWSRAWARRFDGYSLVWTVHCEEIGDMNGYIGEQSINTILILPSCWLLLPSVFSAWCLFPCY